jgi:hypothetical protein
MEALPLEILSAVAEKLPSADVKSFRLVSRRWAYAGYPSLVRHLGVVNTLECMRLVQTLEIPSHGSSLGATKHLTIYHASWPYVTSQALWKIHPAIPLLQDCNCDESTVIAEAYRQFIRTECSRTYESDILEFRLLLQSFPTLESVTLSGRTLTRSEPVQNFHNACLREKPWRIPFFNGRLEEPVFRVISLLNNFPRIRRLRIEGWLDLEDAKPQAKFLNIVDLEIRSITLTDSMRLKTHAFLTSFPNLRKLVLACNTPVAEQSLPLKLLYWQHLVRVELSGLWVAEDTLIDFISRHQLLRVLTIKGLRLVRGSQRSFFTRLRGLPIRVTIHTDK